MGSSEVGCYRAGPLSSPSKHHLPHLLLWAHILRLRSVPCRCEHPHPHPTVWPRFQRCLYYSVLYGSGRVWPFPLHVASELLFWPSEDMMRLVLDSPAVTLTLAFLGEVLRLGTRQYNQVFHRCCAACHPLTHRVQGRSQTVTSCNGHGQANFRHISYPRPSC